MRRFVTHTAREALDHLGTNTGRPCSGRSSGLIAELQLETSKRNPGEDPRVPERSVLMKTTFVDLKNPDLYCDGIPHEVFARLRSEAPVA